MSISLARRLGLGRRLSLGTCFGLAALVVGTGLLLIAVVPAAPPDPGFSARVAAWRNLASVDAAARQGPAGPSRP